VGLFNITAYTAGAVRVTWI